jgi:hypothetical protein
MDDIINNARNYLNYATIKCNAYFLAARICARHHLQLGVAAIAMNALVGTAVFTALNKGAVSTAQTVPNAGEHYSLLVLIIVTFIAAAAATLSALQTFLNYSQRAELNLKAASSYERLRHKCDLFLLKYQDAPANARQSALKELGEILDDFDKTAAGSPAVADSLYDNARERLGLTPASAVGSNPGMRRGVPAAQP